MKTKSTRVLIAPTAVFWSACSFAPAAAAQDLEPKAYTNLPIGLNFVLAGYAHSEGGLATDPSLPIEDAHIKVHSGVFAYARSLDLWGKSGKFDVVLPYFRLSGSALVAGQPATREVRGFGDPRFRLSLNFYGAPALAPSAFAAYQQDLVIGASVQVTAPAGQYDSSKVINLGTHRWSVKPDVGFSKAFGPLTVDLTVGVGFFSTNHDFFGGRDREQAPIYSTQIHVSYAFSGGIWAALGATHYRGGRTTIDGVRKDDALDNTRVGLTVSVPVDKHHSIKFSNSSGVSQRTGSDFDAFGLTWQYRW